MKKTKKKLEEENKQYLDQLKRLQAEFDNFKKRIEKEKQEFTKYSNHKLIAELLNILDSFELALRNTENKEDFVKGIELLYSQFYSVLEKQGLKKINTKGKFDPHFHEVLLQKESDEEEGVILEELQKGYILNDKILRIAKVKISKGVKNE